MPDAGRPVAAASDGTPDADRVSVTRRRASDTVAEALAGARARADLGAFWAIGTERAQRRAADLDAGGASERPALPLSGMPLAVKDNLDLAGLPTTGGLRGEHPAAKTDAAAVTRLENAGAIAIGKTAMDPLAWSTHGQADGFSPCVNPIDAQLCPGGSSSGSAVAVAAGIVPLALGTDTAGSLRIPAAFCGITALKPALGDVPAEGCLPLAPSFDTIGVLAGSVSACATAYEALAGRSVALPESDQGTVGILTDLFEASDPSVADACGAQRPPGPVCRSGLPDGAGSCSFGRGGDCRGLDPVHADLQRPGLGGAHDAMRLRRAGATRRDPGCLSAWCGAGACRCRARRALLVEDQPPVAGASRANAPICEAL